MSRQTQRTAGPVKPVWIVGSDLDTVSGNTLVENITVTEGAWITLMNAQRLDDSPTSANSAIHNVEGYAGVWVLLNIDSTLSPTNVTFIPEFTTDGGTTWWQYLVGIWASLIFDDTAVSAGIRRAFLLPLQGIDKWRMAVTATGTDATNYFDVTIVARAFR